MAKRPPSRTKKNSNEPTPTLSLAPEWLLWMTENLLLGASVEEVRAELLTEGVPLSTIDEAAREIVNSPLFSAATQLAVRARRAEVVLKLQRARAKFLSIEARPTLTAVEFHSHYRAANLPVLLPNFAAAWPAVERWTFEWLRDTYGDQTITVSDGRDEDPDYDRNTADLTRETKVEELVTRILASGDTNNFYAVARNRNLQSGLLNLWADITPEPGFLTDGLKHHSAALWIGPAGTITPLHHDTSDILFCQIRGRKRIRMIAPYEISVAEMAKGLYGPSIESLGVDELVGAPKIHDSQLGPGETLFIPAGWWHHVHALEPSISVALNAFPDNDLSWYQPGPP